MHRIMEIPYCNLKAIPDWEDIPDAAVLPRRTLGLLHLTPLGEPLNGD